MHVAGGGKRFDFVVAHARVRTGCHAASNIFHILLICRRILCTVLRDKKKGAKGVMPASGGGVWGLYLIKGGGGGRGNARAERPTVGGGSCDEKRAVISSTALALRLELPMRILPTRRLTPISL